MFQQLIFSLFALILVSQNEAVANELVLPATAQEAFQLKSEIVTLEGRDYLLSGDQLIEKELIVKKHPLRGARYGALKKWKDGIVPIEFHKDVPANFQENVFNACLEWAKYGRIQCVRGKVDNRSLFVTSKNSGCWSTLGENTLWVTRRMNLQSPGCGAYSIALHEMGHSLGLIHEHQRIDRDDYVLIQKENLQNSINARFNFKITKSKLDTPYDFLSIMHYGAQFYTKDGSVTILPKEPYLRFKNIMGYVRTLSPLDQYAIGEIYGRTELTPTLEQAVQAVYGQ